MSLLIQHGHGKSDKLDSAFGHEYADGVLFAARNEKPERLRQCIETLREEYPDKELLFDPQFYISTFNPPNDRYLPEYPFYKPGLSASVFAKPQSVSKYARDTLKYQQDLGLSALISPSVVFDSFADAWYQVALSLAYASLEAHDTLKDPAPLFLTFVLSEEALASREDVERFLDTITQQDWGMEGFYIIVARSDDGYNQRFEPELLAHLLYATHVLSVTNGLRVICGYTDFVGLLLRAVGADVFATGWSQSLRRFQKKDFIKRKSGGQPPRDRYSSGPLFNSILLGELQDIHVSGKLQDVLSGVVEDEIITSAQSPSAATNWGVAKSQLHHWHTLFRLDDEIEGRPKNDVKKMIKALREADGLYRILESDGVQFERNTNKDHLMQWVDALGRFQGLVGWT